MDETRHASLQASEQLAKMVRAVLHKLINVEKVILVTQGSDSSDGRYLALTEDMRENGNMGDLKGNNEPIYS